MLADLDYPAQSLSFDGEGQLVGLTGSGAWERVAVACTTAGHPLTSAEWQQYVGIAGPGIPNQLAC